MFADSPERRRQSVDTEVVTGNTATISRTESRRCVGVDRDLTQQKKTICESAERLRAVDARPATAATMSDEPARRPAHAPPRPINAYAIFLKTSCGRRAARGWARARAATTSASSLKCHGRVDGVEGDQLLLIFKMAHEEPPLHAVFAGCGTTLSTTSHGIGPRVRLDRRSR